MHLSSFRDLVQNKGLKHTTAVGGCEIEASKMTEEKMFHEYGYPDEQFETSVSDSLHCGICSCVLKEPVMCKNEHCFCRGCITKHLENSQTCPSCNQDLTVESLAIAPRILRNLLSEQKIRCDHHDRGCQEIVQLGNLASHVAVCGKAPVVCANEECSSKINREDQFRHQGEECKFRKKKCENCKEMDSIVQKFGTNFGGLLSEMKTGLTAMEENFEEMKKSRNYQGTPEVSSGDSNDTKHPSANAYLVAGGYNSNSVEIFDKISNSWIQLNPMKKYRCNASSVVYNGHVLVTGGEDSIRVLSSMEQFGHNANPFIPPRWSNLSMQLPRPLKEHHTMVYNGRIIVLGGYDEDDSDMIYEVQDHFPFHTVLAKLPSSTPIRGCGAVLANDKILMFGGCVRNDCYATNKVTLYDIIKNKFKELKPLPYEVCNMATVKCGQDVFLVGGSAYYPNGSVKNTVVSYNIETQESTKQPPMKQNRYACRAVVDGDSLIVMGGQFQNRSLNSVEALDFKTSQWSKFPDMNYSRWGFIAEIV